MRACTGSRSTRTGGNPGPFQDEIVRLTRSLDPMRPITDASGWTQRELTDVIDAHDYSNNLFRQGVPNPVKPKVVGEYGGVALPVPGHTWTQGWGYQLARDPDGLLRRVRSQTTQLFEAPNLSAFVYTQLTDVEQELNGLMTYDRLPKADPRETAAVFEGKSRRRVPRGSCGTGWSSAPFPPAPRLGSAQDSPESRAVLEGVLRKPVPAGRGRAGSEGGRYRAGRGAGPAWKRVRLVGRRTGFPHRVRRHDARTRSPTPSPSSRARGTIETLPCSSVGRRGAGLAERQAGVDGRTASPASTWTRTWSRAEPAPRAERPRGGGRGPRGSAAGDWRPGSRGRRGRL